MMYNCIKSPRTLKKSCFYYSINTVDIKYSFLRPVLQILQQKVTRLVRNNTRTKPQLSKCLLVAHHVKTPKLIGVHFKTPSQAPTAADTLKLLDRRLSLGCRSVLCGQDTCLLCPLALRLSVSGGENTPSHTHTPSVTSNTPGLDKHGYE